MKNSKVLLICIALFTACSEGDGGGTRGQNSVVTAIRNSAPADVCSNGGIQVDAGIDSNSNGVLDPNEITSTQYVCNGVDGTDGMKALVTVVSEPSGTNCSYGGSRVNVGLDTNGNNALDPSEITSFQYVCNGATGPAGPGVTWVYVTGTSVQAMPNTGYMADGVSKVTITLPDSTSLNVGDIVQVSGMGSGGWKIAQNAAQSIITENLDWASHESFRQWQSIASSADGTKLVAVAYGGKIYTSTDSGANWTARDSSRNWNSVASSADGTKLVAVENNGYINTSTDSGQTWTARMSDTPRMWNSVASSADGAKLVALECGSLKTNTAGYIYTSTDSGANWTARDSSVVWNSVASSADGSKLVAVENNGYIYTSTDSGQTWTARMSDTPRMWNSVASSADGTKLVASDWQGIHVSTDSGLSWLSYVDGGQWQFVALSSDGTKLLGVQSMQSYMNISMDLGQTWTTLGHRNWYSVASSSDGTKLAAIEQYGLIYSYAQKTITGTAGSISGGQYDAIELQYIGSNKFVVLSHEGQLMVQ